MKERKNWTVSMDLAKEIGAEAALFVAELLRQSTLKKIDDMGYFQVTRNELFFHTGFSKFKQRNIIEKLECVGILSVKKQRTKVGVFMLYKMTNPCQEIKHTPCQETTDAKGIYNKNKYYNNILSLLFSFSSKNKKSLEKEMCEKCFAKLFPPQLLPVSSASTLQKKKLIPKIPTKKKTPSRKSLKAKALSKKIKFPTVSFSQPCKTKSLSKASQEALQVVMYWNTYSLGSIVRLENSKHLMKVLWFLDEKLLPLYSEKDITRAVANYGLLRAEGKKRAKRGIKKLPLIYFLLGNVTNGNNGKGSWAARLIEPGAEQKYIKPMFTLIQEKTTADLLEVIKQFWKEEKLEGSEVLYTIKEELQFIEAAKRLRLYMDRGMLRVHKPKYNYVNYARVLFDAVLDDWKRWRRISLGNLCSDYTFNQTLPGYVADIYGKGNRYGEE